MKTYSPEQVIAVLNAVVGQIQEAAELPDTGTLDALNLLVNATWVALDNAGVPQPLEQVVASAYSEDELDDVIGWIDG